MMSQSNKGPCFGQRHLQALLLFLAIAVNYIAKHNVGVSIVAMTNAATTNPNFKEFDWNEQQKSFILSSFYWGYIISQLPGGYLCRYFGARRTMFVSTFGSTLFAFLPPIVLDWGGWQIYCFIRAMQGLFQGLLFPSIHAYLAIWCPVNERNRLGALANTGCEFGVLLSMFLSGTIAASDLGWPGISYITGAMGLIWCMFWLLFAANSPKESKYITEDELFYIEALKSTQSENDAEKKHRTAAAVPWRAILTSVPFWSMIATRSSQSWGFSTLQIEIPTYMNGVLLLDMKKNALFSALPYLAMWCMSYVYLIIADILLSKKVLSLNALRKTFNSISFWIPAIGLICVGFVNDDQKELAIALMTVNVGINAGAMIGSGLNTIDLSPNHAGILMGIVNTISNIIPIITPLVVGVIVTDEHERKQWQIVFIISAVVLIFGNFFYLTCGTTNLQAWDDANFLQSKTSKCEAGEAVESQKAEESQVKTIVQLHQSNAKF